MLAAHPEEMSWTPAAYPPEVGARAAPARPSTPRPGLPGCLERSAWPRSGAARRRPRHALRQAPGRDPGAIRDPLCLARPAAHLPDLAVRQVLRLAQAHAAGFRRRQRDLGSGRDHLALGLGDHRHDADHEFVRLRHVGGHEPDAGLLQVQRNAASRDSRSSLAMTSVARAAPTRCAPIIADPSH